MTRSDVRILRWFAFWEDEIDDRSASGRRHLVERIKRICKDERNRALAGSWTYDHGMHRALLSILEREEAALAEAAKPIAAE